MVWHYFKPKFEYEELFPDHIWPWAGHKYFAYDLVRNVKPHVIVELGTHYGTSFFSMVQAVKDEKLKTELHAIDSWEGDPQAGFYDESVIDTVTRLKDTFYPKQAIHLHQMYFDNALPSFKDSSIDLLHIDGLHTYEAVKHDFDTWISKVKPSGIVLFHDTNERKGDFGVYKLWEELEKKYETIQFYHSHGLGVLFKDPYTTKEWKKEEKTMQDHYSAIYDAHYYPAKTEEQDETIRELREYIGKLESGINENAILRVELERYTRNIQILEDQFRLISSGKFFKLWRVYAKLAHGK